MQSSADRALKLHSLRELQPLPADRHHRNGIGRQVGGRRTEPTATGAKTVTKKLFSQSAALLAAVGLSPQSLRSLSNDNEEPKTDRQKCIENLD